MCSFILSTFQRIAFLSNIVVKAKFIDQINMTSEIIKCMLSLYIILGIWMTIIAIVVFGESYFGRIILILQFYMA